jgi:alkylhydroperoxidase/carboxymuconolactone decarboxylase family protein YurZ
MSYVSTTTKGESIMFIDTEKIRELREKYYLQMRESGVKTFQDMGRIETEALESGSLLQKHKELIALGISISQGCYG